MTGYRAFSSSLIVASCWAYCALSSSSARVTGAIGDWRSAVILSTYPLGPRPLRPAEAEDAVDGVEEAALPRRGTQAGLPALQVLGWDARRACEPVAHERNHGVRIAAGFVRLAHERVHSRLDTAEAGLPRQPGQLARDVRRRAGVVEGVHEIGRASC